MITLRKLETLPPRTRLRKIIRLLDGYVRYRESPDERYLEGLIRLARDAAGKLGSFGDGADLLPDADPDTRSPRGAPEADPFRFIDSLRYALRSIIDAPAGDWDLMPPAGFGAKDWPPEQPDSPPLAAQASAAGGRAAPVRVYMESIRSPFNAGSIMRTAAALGVVHVGMSPDCPPADHPRLLRTARGAEQALELTRVELNVLSGAWEPLIALELGGEPVDEFDFPPAGTLLVGSEELGLSGDALGRASRRVSIPMAGLKGSLNVGVACGIALHAWLVSLWMSDSEV